MKKVYLDEIGLQGEEIVNYSKNNIASKIEEVKALPNNFKWQGPAYNSYIASYNKKIEKIESLNRNLTKIAEYLLQVKEEYSSTNQRIENAYNELVDEYEKMRRK